MCVWLVDCLYEFVCVVVGVIFVGGGWYGFCYWWGVFGSGVVVLCCFGVWLVCRLLVMFYSVCGLNISMMVVISVSVLNVNSVVLGMMCVRFIIFMIVIRMLSMNILIIFYGCMSWIVCSMRFSLGGMMLCWIGSSMYSSVVILMSGNSMVE